ncbi:TRAP transporter small permease [Sneathiella sp.]|jgi:TRAP-type C4-dicarboxylate transport system permease small subunit|uniref:TRAP transporter small permease n=1 Tax=Sneathiella sp. TaxID=1964365 RepID=UPI0039E5697F
MFISRMSDSLLKLESAALKLLMAGLLGLILLNVVTRSFSYALYWVDESAIYCMIWVVFTGASVAIRKRHRIAVTLIFDTVSPKTRHFLNIVIDGIILCFSAFMLWLIWRWYDPIGLMNSGFDFEAFSADSFNFIYDEPTNTIGLKKFWIWLILPLSFTTIFIHALANLTDSLANRETMPDRTTIGGID